jgi:MoxR-like ATPase
MFHALQDLRNETKRPAAAPVLLPKSLRAGRDLPQFYEPDAGLADAMYAAIRLRRPLLITGEPGTGKTQAAHYLSWKLAYGAEALRFDAKSTSSARDLFYTYNMIGRFQAVQTGEGSQKSVDYITYNALGEAIIRAQACTDALSKWLPNDFAHAGEPIQRVVLIDEVDKAPRDFPNDVLNEIEHLKFRVSEFGNIEFAADPEFQPVVIITSNSERNLPAAFLRRCVYYNIPRPGRERFAHILKARLSVDPENRLMKDALDFLIYLRGGEVDLSKKPATAEFLDFVLFLLAQGALPEQPFKEVKPIVLSALVTVIKDEGRDLNKVLDAWPGLSE